MTKKHKELLALAETRSKELNDYLNERGDNITAKDLDHAHAIRDDLKKIKGDIEAEKEIDAKRSSVSKELTEFRSWMDDPAGDPAIHRIKVLGSSRAGETTITRGGRSASHRRAIKVLEERGAAVEAAVVEDVLLEHRLCEAHVRAPLHLPLDDHRVE